MTSTTDELAELTDLAEPTRGGRRERALRFVGAFVVGAAVASVLAVSAVLAFEAHYAGRILPGVHVGSVDASGLSSAALAARLRASYQSLTNGSLVLQAPDGDRDIAYADVGRAIDAEGLAADALATGRSANPLERIAAEARLVLRGVTIPARTTFDASRLEARIAAVAASVDRAPVDASLVATSVGFVPTHGAPGRAVDVTAATAAATAALGALDLPATVTIAMTATAVEPAVTDAEADAAVGVAQAMVRDVVLSLSDGTWRIGPATVTRWISFQATPDGRLEPVLDRAAIAVNLKSVAKKIDRAPQDAAFLTGKGSVVVGVDPAVDGRTLDIPATADLVAAAVLARSTPGNGTPAIVPAVAIVPPKLTTEQAEKVAPAMTRVSSWTTYYPIGIKNGYGANIEIPTRQIDGTVVPAGGTFDFWSVVGPVSTAAGYRQGGAIINGRTEPQGALAGGICSCSTTLFNAALRAGYSMGARQNHYYYIDRYPLGLDATVWISSGGWVQSMSWTNDTAYPVLIRGFISHDGLRGYVTFELWTVPNGRTVSFTTPIVKNLKPATTITQDSDTIPVGTRQQVEWPVDGKDVWVTRTVRDASGAVVHTETYYSHYARVDGIILVGVPKGAISPTPGAITAPLPSPSPTTVP
ncbi:MAG TPA: VanW family protein [Candidatus Limnocylindrales bacterium]